MASPTEIPRLLEIHHQAIQQLCHDTLDASQIAAWVARENEASFASYLKPPYQNRIAIVHGRILGFVIIKDNEIMKIFVDPAHAKGSGIGRRLMRRAESLIRRNGHQKMVVEASLHAAPFYQRLGFRFHEARDYDMPNGSRITVHWMERILPPIGLLRGAHLRDR